MRKIQTLHYVGLLWSIRKDGRGIAVRQLHSARHPLKIMVPVYNLNRDDAMDTKKSRKTTKQSPITLDNAPPLIFDAGDKRFIITDKHHALFKKNSHKESLKVLLAVVDNWADRSIKEFNQNNSSAYTLIASSLVKDLNDYISQACSLLATYPTQEHIDAINKTRGGAI
jgi:hypothetical protein